MVGMLWQGQDVAGFVLGIGACTSQQNKHRQRGRSTHMPGGCSGVADWTQKRLILHRSSAKDSCP